METNPTRILTDFVVKTRYDDLPEDVIHETKRIILDTIGCAIAGFSIEKSKIIIETVRDLGGEPESTILATGDKTSCANASFVNAELANALDLDETLLNFTHHANCVVSSALAIGERVEATGKEVLASIALGYEVASRIGISLITWRMIGEPPEQRFELLPSYGMSYAVFGAAVAAGKLLGLNGEQMRNAFGIAGYSAPLPNLFKYIEANLPESYETPMTKYACYGSIAQVGTIAALLAQKGFTGDRTVLDGDHGYWRMQGADRCEWGQMTGELGKKWWIKEVAFKPYPTCRLIHGALDIFYKIMREQKLSPEEIENVNVKIPLIQSKFLFAEPRDDSSTQFSVPYVFAVAALGRKPGPDWHTPDALKDPKVRDFIKRVEVERIPLGSIGESSIHKQLIEGKINGWRRHPSTVEVTAGGRKISGHSEYAKGDPWTTETRMSDDELNEKFRTCSYRLLRTTNIEKAIKTIYELEKLGNIEELAKILCA